MKNAKTVLQIFIRLFSIILIFYGLIFFGLNGLEGIPILIIGISFYILIRFITKKDNN